MLFRVDIDDCKRNFEEMVREQISHEMRLPYAKRLSTKEELTVHNLLQTALGRKTYVENRFLSKLQ